MNDTLTITLTGPVKDFVETQAAQGGHATPDEYVATILSELQRRAAHNRLEAMLLQGIQSPAAPLDAAEWDAIRREARERLARERPA